MLPLVCATEIVGGALLLSSFLRATGLAILAPVVVNIFFFHLFLAPEGFPLAITVAVLELFLAFQYRAAFAGVFSSPALQ